MATSNPTFDYETQAANITRRRGIVDALQGLSMQPIQQQSVGGITAPTSWADVMAKLVQGYAGMKGQKKVDAEQSELSTRYANDAKTGLEKFYRTLEGQNYRSGVLKPDAHGNAQQVTVPGDRRKAVLEAMTSNHPLLRNLGQTLLTEDMKGQLTAKDLAGLANPADVLAQPGNPGGWGAKPNLMGTTPGEVIIDQNTGRPFEPKPTASGQPAYNILERNGDVYQQTWTGERKLDNAPNVTVNNALPPGAAFEKALAEAEAGRFSEALATRDQMVNTTKAITEARQLVDQELFNGIAGNLAMNAKRLDAALFGGDTSKVARTETFKNNMGTVILPAMKQLGGNDSNEELRRMEAWLAGDITLTPDAIRNTLDRFASDLQRQAGEIDAVANQVRQSTGIPTLNLPRYGGNAQAPGAGGTGNSADDPIPFDEFMRQFGSGAR